MIAKLTLSAIASIAVLAAASAQARPFLQQDVTELGKGVFEVTGRIGDGAADYWCGAGDYALRVLRAGATDRIFIWRGIGPSTATPGKKAVQFAFRAPAGANTAPRVSLSVDAVGDNMTVSAARQFCFDRVLFER